MSLTKYHGESLYGFLTLHSPTFSIYTPIGFLLLRVNVVHIEHPSSYIFFYIPLDN